MQQRAARHHAKLIILAEGSGPWLCYCGEPITELGRRSGQGIVHHRNEDPFDNRLENLEVMHFACHIRHHGHGGTKDGAGAAAKKRWTGVPKTEEQKRKLSESVKAAWERGDFADRKRR